MLHKIKKDELILIGSILEDYLCEKQTNNILWAWKMFKKNKTQHKHQFSTASFAKPKSYTDKFTKKQVFDGYQDNKSYRSGVPGPDEHKDQKKYF